jgi:hypothetical protein
MKTSCVVCHHSPLEVTLTRFRQPQDPSYIPQQRTRNVPVTTPPDQVDHEVITALYCPSCGLEYNPNVL